MSESREVTIHHVGREVDVRIFATGQPNPAGANNSYVVGEVEEDKITNCLGVIQFQSGHPAEHGRNGFTIEALLAICHDRLQSFQAGLFPSTHNALAIQGIERALESLKDRTRERDIFTATLEERAPCATLGPSCRGCPDCMGIPYDEGTAAALQKELGVRPNADC